MFGKKMVEGKATIMADEGMVRLSSSGTGAEGTAWCHCKYIVEVQPETGAAFRAETKAKVPYLGGPDEGSSAYTPLDPELQALMDADEAERNGARPAAARSASTAAPASRLDQLKELGELREQGVLTDAEFEQEKARILSEQ